MEEKESYRSIAKSTSIFGGVQVLQIIITIIRGKFIAVLIGATGMGYNAIFASITNLVVQIFNLGLNLSAVREISTASETQDQERLSRTVKTFKRWLLICAILGALTTALLSPYISELSFGNRDYTWWIVGLGLVVFFTLYGNANLVLLQGLRRLKYLAKGTIVGLFGGLFITIPIYYFWGIDGIIPSLIVSSILVYLTNLWYARKVELQKVTVTFKESLNDGREMVKLGVVLMIGQFLGTMVIYMINIFISRHGNIVDVGLFNAGVGITTQYIGVVFAAMGVDFFPKLAAICQDKYQANKLVNQQSEMVIILVAPLVIIMMLTAPLIIRLLLTAEFLVITDFVTILAFGMIFKAIAFAVGYMSFAKGDKKLFFYFEGLLGNIVLLSFVIAGYHFGGLIGMAIAYLCVYLSLYVTLLFIVRARYGFVLERTFIKIVSKMTLMALIVFIQTRYFANVYGYIIGSCVMLISVWYAYKLLDERLDIKQLLSRFRKNKQNDE